MDKAKQHWEIMRQLPDELANKVRQFMVIGPNGEGVIVITENGQGFWLGTMKYGIGETIRTDKPFLLNVSDLVQMAHGYNFILLLNKRGDIFSMGWNDYGQLGIEFEDGETYYNPQSIESPHSFVSVRCGKWHSMALTDDGKVFAWGDNEYCQIGCSNKRKKFLTVPSMRQISKLNRHRIVAIECGAFHSLALTDRGEVFGWGRNDWGQLGYCSLSSKSAVKRIPTSSPVKSMAAGYQQTLLLTESGEVYACGENCLPDSCFEVVKVDGLPTISEIAAHPSLELSIAVSTDQRCYVWGRFYDRTQEMSSITVSIPRIMSPHYTTVDSPLSIYSNYRYFPHSVPISEIPPNLTVCPDIQETSLDVQPELST